jgi:hypothetical protein
MAFQQTTTNRPRAYITAQGVVIPDSMLDESFRGQYDASSNLIYKGFARPGSPTSQPVWQIAFLTYDGNGNVLMIQWPLINDANGNLSPVASNDYLFIWDNRATYTYA